MENKFKISSNTNSLIIYLNFILQFVSILFSAYIQNIVVKYTVNILKSKCGRHLSTATHYLQQINLGSELMQDISGHVEARMGIISNKQLC